MAQVKKELIRKAILKQAFKTIKRDGYEAMSLRNIALECNISVSNLYNYFRNKEAILDNLVGDFYTQCMRLSKTNKMKPVSLCQKDYLDYLEAATETLETYIIKNKELLYVLIFQTKGSKYESFCDDIVDRYYEYEMWSVTGAFEGSSIPTIKGPSSIMIKNQCGMYINLCKCFLSENKSNEWLTKYVHELNLFIISGLGIYLKKIVK